MKDKIYKLNRPKGFHACKRALIAAASVFMGSVMVAVPLSIAIYTGNSNIAPETVETDIKKSTTVEDENLTLKQEASEEIEEAE